MAKNSAGQEVPEIPQCSCGKQNSAGQCEHVRPMWAAPAPAPPAQPDDDEDGEDLGVCEVCKEPHGHYEGMNECPHCDGECQPPAPAPPADKGSHIWDDPERRIEQRRKGREYIDANGHWSLEFGMDRPDRRVADRRAPAATAERAHYSICTGCGTTASLCPRCLMCPKCCPGMDIHGESVTAPAATAPAGGAREWLLEMYDEDHKFNFSQVVRHMDAYAAELERRVRREAFKEAADRLRQRAAKVEGDPMLSTRTSMTRCDAANVLREEAAALGKEAESPLITES